MALSLGGLSGALSKASSSLGGETSLKKFLHRMSQVGIQIKSRYEINFSGLSDFTFFATSIETPRAITQMGTLSFGGRSLSVPILQEYEHNVSVTMINDSSGYIYPQLVNLLASGSIDAMSNNGFSMTIKGIGDKHSKGQTITLNGVRIVNVGGLSYGSSENDVQTFNVDFWVKDFSCGSGLLGKAGGIAGAAKSLLGL